MQTEKAPNTEEQSSENQQQEIIYTYNEDEVASNTKHTKHKGWWRWMRKHLNFFRIFLLAFIFLPLISSVLFWGVSTEYKIDYIDCLYISYSTITNTGLSPMDLSRTTTLQQAIMFIQMTVGSPIFISWVVVMVRKRIMATQCAHWVAEQRGLRKVFSEVLTMRSKTTDVKPTSSQVEQGKRVPPPRRRTTGVIKPFQKSSIRRVDTELRMVDPSGQISRRVTRDDLPDIVYQPATRAQTLVQPADFAYQPDSPSQEGQQPIIFDSPRSQPAELVEGKLGDGRMGNGTSSPPLLTNSPITPVSARPADAAPLSLVSTRAGDTAPSTPRIVEFNVPMQTYATGTSAGQPRHGTLRQRGQSMGPRNRTFTEIDIRPRQRTLKPSPSYNLPQVDHNLISKRSIGLGGFPGPIELFRIVHNYLSARLRNSKYGNLFRPTPSILLPAGQTRPAELARYDTKEVPYFSFSAVVGKNSTFHGLTEEQLDELGGVEYRGLRMLAWWVPVYYVAIQALGWAVDAALFSKPQYLSLFQGQWKFVQPSWAGVFMGTSAVTNTGMSLVDTSLIPFQGEFGILVITAFQSLAGNTAFPIFLRLTIWIATKILPTSTESWATLHFLLDHPRRCFLYLFPSHQTWFLVSVLFLLNMIDWAGFMLFDIGNPVLEAIPVNWRVINGLLQATSVRCSGIASVSISLLAPATQTLFLIMMYIAPYPIALAVRSSNVYQDRSLGIYEEEEDSDDEDEKEREFERDKRAKPVVWGSYLAWHARRQLSYDIWWVAGAWLLISIFERGKIWDPETKQFDLFGILFELISAYGSVGLSLGLSNANYSLSGAWSTPSKVVLCLVMVRGRSRGLPVAIDRAIMLPKEFNGISTTSTMQDQQQPQEEKQQQQQQTQQQPELPQPFKPSMDPIPEKQAI